MPIQSNADYIPTMDLFIAHWTVVDAAGALTVPLGALGVLRGDFEGHRGDLDAKKSQVETLLNDLEISRVTVNQARVVATARLSEFNKRIRAQFPNSPHFAKLPTVPAPTSGRDAFLTAMDDAKDLWTRINALAPTASFTAPLVLQGGFTLANFSTSRTAMDAAFTARGSAETQLRIARVDRDLLQKNALQIMTGYRALVEALHAEDSSFVLTLPRLSPLPGHTPDPVAATAVWNATAEKAEITWPASTDDDLQDYQLRGLPGEEYNADDATVVATILPGEPRVFLTDAGFSIPGMTWTYKLFVRLKTGNETGSEAVTVTRPE